MKRHNARGENNVAYTSIIVVHIVDSIVAGIHLFHASHLIAGHAIAHVIDDV